MFRCALVVFGGNYLFYRKNHLGFGKLNIDFTLKNVYKKSIY